MIDTLTNNEIDFLHMIVSAQAIYNTRIPLISDLAGWAGDLQQAIGDLQQYQKDNNITDNLDDLTAAAKLIIATSRSSGFSLRDMLADVDAYNIGKSLSCFSKLSEVIRNYSSDDVNSRYDNFVRNNGGIDALHKKTESYTVYANWGGPVYTNILNNFKQSDITKNQLKALNNAFMDYIKANITK